MQNSIVVSILPALILQIATLFGKLWSKKSQMLVQAENWYLG